MRRVDTSALGLERTILVASTRASVAAFPLVREGRVGRTAESTVDARFIQRRHERSYPIDAVRIHAVVLGVQSSRYTRKQRRQIQL